MKDLFLTLLESSTCAGVERAAPARAEMQQPQRHEEGINFGSTATHVFSPTISPLLQLSFRRTSFGYRPLLCARLRTSCVASAPFKAVSHPGTLLMRRKDLPSGNVCGSIFTASVSTHIVNHSPLPWKSARTDVGNRLETGIPRFPVGSDERSRGTTTRSVAEEAAGPRKRQEPLRHLEMQCNGIAAVTPYKGRDQQRGTPRQRTGGCRSVVVL